VRGVAAYFVLQHFQHYIHIYHFFLLVLDFIMESDPLSMTQQQPLLTTPPTPTTTTTNTGTGDDDFATTNASKTKKKRQHNNNNSSSNEVGNNNTVMTMTAPVLNNNDAQPSQQIQLQQQPITIDGERPMKRYYRQRAHCNPLAHNDTYDYPIHPTKMIWYDNTNLYPYPPSNTDPSSSTELPPSSPPHPSTRIVQPTVLDIGCGFGGLTLALSSVLPDEHILGMEIRAKVTEYVRLRILAARQSRTYTINPHAIKSLLMTNTIPTDQQSLPALLSPLPHQQQDESATQNHHHHYNNCAVLRTNSMKFLPNYFHPHSISKLFFCILSYRLLDEYAFILKKKHKQQQQQPTNVVTADDAGDGKLYAITDVKELHEWHVIACDTHPLFQCITIGQQVSIHYNCHQVDNEKDDNVNDIDNNNTDDDDDPCIYAMKYLTEEGQKVDRNGGIKYYIIYQYCGCSNSSITQQLHSGNFFL
jgi:tRNA (guanine-N7-)-methyltransferase